jgi:hypothetical protein
MKVLVLLLASQFFFSSPLVMSAVQGDVVIHGTVVDEESGQRVGGAVVYAVSDGNVAKTTADSMGNFFFLTLLPGEYQLCASKRGYALDCGGQEAMLLSAGLEYSATVILSRAMR